MKTIYYILLVPFFLLSCSGENKKDTIASPHVKQQIKLEKLFLLPHDSVMNHYDLSNDSIVHFPDLSSFTIKFLDLSYNLLDSIKPYFLPKGLERLNLSHNLYRGFVVIEKNVIPSLKELDMSYNALNKINICQPLFRIILSNNDLKYVNLNHKNIQYLDISYNSTMSDKVSFEPLWIDTVVRYGVADGKRLLGPISVSYGCFHNK